MRSISRSSLAAAGGDYYTYFAKLSPYFEHMGAEIRNSFAAARKEARISAIRVKNADTNII